MNALLIIGLLILNVLISVWNCYAVGTAWKDTMALGGWFNKTLLWSGIIQSGIGFSMPIIWMFGIILSLGESTVFTAVEINETTKSTFYFWYILVILPAIGSGLAIWAHAIREVYRRRDFTSFAVAGFNSFTQVHNVVSAVDNLGGTFGNVNNIFGIAFKGDKGSNFIIVLLIAIGLIIASGFIIAFSLVRHYAKKTNARIEEYGDYREFGFSR